MQQRSDPSLPEDWSSIQGQVTATIFCAVNGPDPSYHWQQMCGSQDPHRAAEWVVIILLHYYTSAQEDWPPVITMRRLSCGIPALLLLLSVNISLAAETGNSTDIEGESSCYYNEGRETRERQGSNHWPLGPATIVLALSLCLIVQS